jgi:hypothetical protein
VTRRTGISRISAYLTEQQPERDRREDDVQKAIVMLDDRQRLFSAWRERNKNNPRVQALDSAYCAMGCGNVEEL